MEIVAIILFIISLCVAIPLVNVAQRWFMKIIGIDSMFFSIKKKVIAIFVVAIIITSLILGVIMKIFGISL